MEFIDSYEYKYKEVIDQILPEISNVGIETNWLDIFKSLSSTALSNVEDLNCFISEMFVCMNKYKDLIIQFKYQNIEYQNIEIDMTTMLFMQASYIFLQNSIDRGFVLSDVCLANNVLNLFVYICEKDNNVSRYSQNIPSDITLKIISSEISDFLKKAKILLPFLDNRYKKNKQSLPKDQNGRLLYYAQKLVSEYINNTINSMEFNYENYEKSLKNIYNLYSFLYKNQNKCYSDRELFLYFSNNNHEMINDNFISINDFKIIITKLDNFLKSTIASRILIENEPFDFPFIYYFIYKEYFFGKCEYLNDRSDTVFEEMSKDLDFEKDIVNLIQLNSSRIDNNDFDNDNLLKPENLQKIIKLLNSLKYKDDSNDYIIILNIFNFISHNIKNKKINDSVFLENFLKFIINYNYNNQFSQNLIQNNILVLLFDYIKSGFLTDELGFLFLTLTSEENIYWNDNIKYLISLAKDYKNIEEYNINFLNYQKTRTFNNCKSELYVCLKLYINFINYKKNQNTPEKYINHNNQQEIFTNFIKANKSLLEYEDIQKMDIILPDIFYNDKLIDIILKNKNLIINTDIILIWCNHTNAGFIKTFKLYVKLGMQREGIRWYNYIGIYINALFSTLKHVFYKKQILLNKEEESDTSSTFNNSDSDYENIKTDSDDENNLNSDNELEENNPNRDIFTNK